MAELEIEFGLSLTEKGYRLLKKELDWRTKSERFDFYFDVFDGNDFFLAENSSWKWRLKLGNGKTKGEISFLEKQTNTEGTEIRLRTSLRRSSQAGTKERDLGPLVKSTRKVSDYVIQHGDIVDMSALQELSAALDQKLNELEFYPELVREKVRSGAKLLTLPGYWNSKKRRGMLLEFAETDLEIFIERKTFLDAEGNEVSTFALEAEPQASLDNEGLKRTEEELIDFLGEIGLVNGHISTVSPDAWAFMRHVLAKINVEAG